MDTGANLVRVYLVRHGETDWSLSGQHTSRTDLPLTAHGEAQSQALAALVGHVVFSRVFSSPRLRALQTCRGLGWNSITTEVEPDLAEWDYGDYEGQRSADIRGARPDWNLFVDGCPGGETPAQVSDRADRVLMRLRTLQGNVGLCSHGHFGRVLGARWIGLPVLEAQHLLLDTASVSVLGHDHHSETPAIVSWNASPQSD